MIVAAVFVVSACQNETVSPAVTPAEVASATPLSDTATATIEPQATIISPGKTPEPTTAPPTTDPGPVATPTSTAIPVPASPKATATPVSTSTPGTSSGSSSAINHTPTPEPEFVPIPREPDIPVPPDRDLQDLGRRLVKGYVEPPPITASEPLVVGQKVDFWVSRDNGSVLVSGQVAYVSEHAYWVFENAYVPDHADIQQAAEDFETIVWPAVTGVFGTPLAPGIDGDDRIVVFHSVLRSGVAGYFSSADSYARQILPFSNQREALYMSANRIDLTSSEYLSVIAHELQHATHFATDSSEDSWVNEGLSEVAAEIAGFARTAVSAFVRAPSTSLTAWAQEITTSTANYGAANLFFDFLATHYGGNEMLAAVARNQEDGIASIGSALREQGFDVTANDVYRDWIIANYLTADEGPYSYRDRMTTPVRNIYKRAPDRVSGTVKGYAADYYVTSTGSGRMSIEFQGEPGTSLLSAPPHSGESCWWSSHGDSIDSTLTRSVDLTEVENATLRYWTIYEIEEFWDYAYVMVSADAGLTWDILDTVRATTSDPNGNAYGAGLTGKSPGWVQDSVDLSNYSGQRILLRFEYITDDAVFSRGACFDDFEIPEINWSDDTSDNGDWITNGFALVAETVPTQYMVQVIHEKSLGDPVVYELPVDASASGVLVLDEIGGGDLVIVVVSAVTRHTTTSTEYTLGINP